MLSGVLAEAFRPPWWMVVFPGMAIKARGALEKAGYRLSPDVEAVLRAYYSVPEDRLLTSVTYERPVAGRGHRGHRPGAPGAARDA